MVARECTMVMRHGHDPRVVICAQEEGARDAGLRC